MDPSADIQQAASELPGGEARARVIQTHLSYVLMGERRVWKLKKPLDLGFADFTTLARRRHFCEEEVRLNRRLATIYEGVDEVRRTPAGDRIGAGEGPVVDYAVRMKRLPDDASALALLGAGRLTAEHLARLAERIARFHRDAARSAEITRIGSYAGLLRAAADNFVRCAASPAIFDAAQVARVRAWSEGFAASHADLFAAREEAGAIGDLHGDLHLDHVYFVPDLEVIDCIEFNPGFRCGDVAAEIAFLAMDLDYRRRPDLAGHWLSRYLERTQDYEALGVLRFHLCYRAMVRAKVAGIAAEEPEIAADQRRAAVESARAHLALADRTAGSDIVPPFIAVMTGLVGSGKSRVAQRISERTGAIVVATDRVRKHLLGLGARESAVERFGDWAYGAEMNDRVYARLLDVARWAQEAGRPVVLDGVFPVRHRREDAAALARGLGAPFAIFEATAPEAVLYERLERRRREGGDPSDAGPELLAPLRARYEPADDREGRVFRLATDAPADELDQALGRALEEWTSSRHDAPG
ncbi:MAG: AAA family ATPase [Myxococcales bacterium]|nr:AAA family ATPase [Myxococcales bacterium]